MTARVLGGRRGLLALGIVLPFATPLYAPQLLAFPYRAATPVGTVWSESPISPEALAANSTAVQTRLATTPLAEPNDRVRVAAELARNGGDVDALFESTP